MARIGNANTLDGLFKIERGPAFYSALSAYTQLHELQKEGGDQDLIVKMKNAKISHLEQTKIEKL